MNKLTETILNQAADKQRIVVTGSRGTTTLASMLIHVLTYYKRPFDYAISAAGHGISETSRLSSGGPLIIIEANEQNMLDYKHHIGLITNIMWTASADYPTADDYVKRFDQFADSTPKAGLLYYCENDPLALLVGAKPRPDVLSVGYKIHSHTSDSGNHFITSGKDKIPVNIYGSQNFQNISGAKELLKRIGITADQFYKALSSFPL
jgi:UDP-N-acetylmuramate: L-alanyl-gamma-D-glutamyl-meso-diaminopimelate ligase